MSDDHEAPGLTVTQMAAATGVSAHTLRYYERAGLIRPIARTSGHHRRYSEPDIDWLRFLLRLRETGMPIAQMQTYTELRAEGPQSTAARVALLESHRASLLERIALLQQHERALATKITTYRHDLAEMRASDEMSEGTERDD